MPRTPAEERRARRLVRQRVLDLVFLVGTGAVAAGVGLVVLALIYQLLGQTGTFLYHGGWGFLSGQTWDTTTNVFGAVPFLAGTLVTSAVALLIGVPVSLGIAIFLSQEVRGPIGQVLASLVELLAAIPSVVFGFWALFVLVPIMHYQVEPFLHATLGQVPGIGPWFPGVNTGTDVLTAGVILSIMIIPTISAVSRETMAAVPNAQKEAALALGATRWETTRTGVLPYARVGILGAIVLGLGRALGETMAVTMTIGNANHVPTSLFSQGQSIASAIATLYPEHDSALQDHALFAMALILLLITLGVNLFARGLMRGLFKGATTEA